MKKLVIIFLLLSSASCWALPPCSESEEYWSNCEGEWAYENSDKYVGEFKDNKRHGQGTYTYASGDKYVGEFKDGASNGQGTLYYLADNEWKGDKYVGEFKDDEFHGQGTYYHNNDDKYVGEFKDNKPRGQGTFYHLADDEWKGDKYVGEVKDGKKHGQGTYTYASSGDKYVGEFKDDEANGQGTYTYANGDKYVGEHKDGRAHGQGTFYHLADDEWKGDKYVGEFKDDEFHGQGTYYHNNDDKYVGEFKDNKPRGQGTFYHLADDEWKGDKYVGEVKDGKKHGQGTYYHNNGDKYVGEFKDNKPRGQGTYYHLADNEWKGDKYVGEFKNWLPDGQGTFYHHNGDKYVGEFKDDEITGQGTYFFADGTKNEGIWENGELISSSEPVIERENIQKAAPIDQSLREVTSGTGFVVSESGHLVTNYHVIEGCNTVYAEHKGQTSKIEIVASEKKEDLALLKINQKTKVVFPVRQKDPELMEEVRVFGYPLGYFFDKELKQNKGEISGEATAERSWFQTNAIILEGNSGGPIVDEKGNVVGVAVATADKTVMAEEYGIKGVEGIHFGIKVSILNKFLIKNNIETKTESETEISKSKLRHRAKTATYYLSCLMTEERFSEMQKKEKKMYEDVSFENPHVE